MTRQNNPQVSTHWREKKEDMESVAHNQSKEHVPPRREGTPRTRGSIQASYVGLPYK
uniref:Uncharacterized protein n=1 Tax=Arundo donax TaxID=35708 RepID=A0A0A9EA43_ARUDO